MARVRLFAALPAAALALVGSLTPAPAASDNPMFQRHFWRGQHGHGNIDFHGRSTARTATGASSAEALVEEGTPGAAIARGAAACGRAEIYDPATGTYIGRDGRRRACR